MIYIIIGVSVVFIGLAYILTEDNVKYLLSGYNTMSKKEQGLFDIKSFIPFFKKFHIALGVSCLAIGLLLAILIGEKMAVIFLTLYPIAAYIFFIQKSNTFYQGLNKSSNKLAQLFLIGILIFLIVMFYIKEF